MIGPMTFHKKSFYRLCRYALSLMPCLILLLFFDVGIVMHTHRDHLVPSVAMSSQKHSRKLTLMVMG